MVFTSVKHGKICRNAVKIYKKSETIMEKSHKLGTIVIKSSFRYVNIREAPYTQYQKNATDHFDG
jgi:hypothetical protein